MKKELIEELEKIRIRITQIYIELGNPDYVEADSVLSNDINKLRNKLNLQGCRKDKMEFDVQSWDDLMGNKIHILRDGLWKEAYVVEDGIILTGKTQPKKEHKSQKEEICECGHKQWEEHKCTFEPMVAQECNVKGCKCKKFRQKQKEHKR